MRVEIPEITDIEIVFPAGLPELNRFTKEVADTPFRKNWINEPWCDYVQTLFFKGGTYPEVQEGVTKEEYTRLFRYVRALLGSYEPKHEDKIAVIAYLLSQYCVLKA